MNYTVSLVLRRKGQNPADTATLKTEDFNDDEELCQALASRAMEMLGEVRDLEDGDE